MEEILLRLSSKGQVTIPAQVRRHLGVQKNQKVALVIEPDGTVRLQLPRYPSVEAVRGAAGALNRELTWDETRQIAHEDGVRRKLNQARG